MIEQLVDDLLDLHKKVKYFEIGEVILDEKILAYGGVPRMYDVIGEGLKEAIDEDDSVFVVGGIRDGVPFFAEDEYLVEDLDKNVDVLRKRITRVVLDWMEENGTFWVIAAFVRNVERLTLGDEDIDTLKTKKTEVLGDMECVGGKMRKVSTKAVEDFEREELNPWFPNE